MRSTEQRDGRARPARIAFVCFSNGDQNAIVFTPEFYSENQQQKNSPIFDKLAMISTFLRLLQFYVFLAMSNTYLKKLKPTFPLQSRFIDQIGFYDTEQISYF